MADKFVFIAGEEKQLLINLSQVFLVELEQDAIVLRSAAGHAVRVTGTGGAELREVLRKETVMTNGAPVPADFVI